MSSVENIRNTIRQTPTYDAESTEKLKQFCENNITSNTSLNIPLLSILDVKTLIYKLNNKKSLDIHNLNAPILKMSMHYIAKPLTFIYNLSITHNKFPIAFKQAKVIPIPKSSDTSSLDNFRPISILSILSKPLEKHIHISLYSYIEENHLFHRYQSGFRKNHSSHTAIAHLCDSWLNSINNKNMVGAVFLDLRKAFDLVDHNILLDKLQLYLQSDNYLPLFSSYLSERQQTVYVNGTYSSFSNLKCGVPQGSILGPILFCLYINDLPLYLSQPDAVLELFADDSTLHSQNTTVDKLQTTIQTSLVDINNWCQNNNMILHPKKSKCMVIATRQKHQTQSLHLNLMVGSTRIEQVREHKILGVIVDNELNWRSHINSISSKISRNLFLMKKMSFFVSKEALKIFFHAHCLSHLNYISTVWCNASDNITKRLYMLHRRGVKLLEPDSTIDILEKYSKTNILPLKQQFILNVGIVMFKIKEKNVPMYLSDLMNNSNFHGRHDHYKLPLPRIDLFKTSLSFWGAREWNSFPDTCKQSGTINAFKISLKKHLQN
jgi:hypothetical protein